MKEIKRICSLCCEDATPKTPGGIYQVNTRRGFPLGLFCKDCYCFVLKAVDMSPRCYRHAGWLDTEEGNRTAYNWIINTAKELRFAARMPA